MKNAQDIRLNLHQLEAKSPDYGPGLRSVLWMQGCPFDCPGCHTHGAQEFLPHKMLSIAEIISWMPLEEIEGVTISGGEPFCQIQGLNLLCREMKKHNKGIIIYSGYTLQALKDKDEELIYEVLDLCDVLIDGIYIKELKRENSWTPTSNQQVHFFSPRYEPVTSCPGRQ